MKPVRRRLPMTLLAAALAWSISATPLLAENPREAWRDGFRDICRVQAEMQANCRETARTIASNIELAEGLNRAAIEQELPDPADALQKLLRELEQLQPQLACDAGNEFCGSDGDLEEAFDKSTSVCGLPDEVDCGELTRQFNDRVAQGNEQIVAHNRVSNRNNEIADLLEAKKIEIVAVAEEKQLEAESVICRDESDCIARARRKPGRDGVEILRFACDGAPQSAGACNELGWAIFTGLWEGDPLLGDIDEGLNVLQRACSLGHEETCARLAEIPDQLDLPQMRLEMAEKNESLRKKLGEE